MLRNRPTMRVPALRFARERPVVCLLLLLLALPGIAACSGTQSALDPHGPVAESITHTWWVLFWGAAIILALVMGLVFYAMFLDPERKAQLPHLPFLIGAGLVFPTVVLTALVVFGTLVGRDITRAHDDALVIEVTGHQWWWEVRYPATTDAPEVVTANELRLPVGVPVEFVIESADVVHSFWIPNLGGKVDMIPGRTNTLRLEASRPGRFRAQCAEFCGAQHSRMGFIAIATDADEFERWRRARASAPEASGPGLARFDALGCAGCHGLGGRAADGGVGPVLTHFAERPTVGAGAARNTPEALRAWLTDHGARMKPGSLGPAERRLDDADVEAIAGLLEQQR